MTSPNLASADDDDPLRHFAAAHKSIEGRLALLKTAARQLTPAVSREVVKWISEELGELEREGVLHARDEEESLFPRIRGKLSPDSAAHLDVLSQQHKEALELFVTLNSLLDLLHSSPSAEQRSHAIARIHSYIEPFAEHYRFHIGFEEREVLGLAKRVLTEGDLGEIGREMRDRRRNPKTSD